MFTALLLLCLFIIQEDRMIRYIYAFSVWTLLCFSITECLSVFDAISTKNLWLCWLGVDIVLVIILVLLRRFNLESIKECLVKRKLEHVDVFWGIFAVVVLLLAVIIVQFNWDSMTYHLARVFHWYQNGSVDFYATAIDRQVASPIGGAYIVLHVYTMSGGNDCFVALPQCLAFLTNGILVYNITRKIGCSKKYCNLAALLFYSMPIALAEAFTTQVDNLAAMWMLATVYLLLDLLWDENCIEWNRSTFVRVLILSLCVAFGYLTKPSIGIGLLFFAIWLLITAIKRKDNFKPIIIYLLIAGLVLTILLIPGFYRNLLTFDAISAPSVGKRQLVGTLNPIEVFVNCIKNITFNMPTAWIYKSSKMIFYIVPVIARVLQVDINNPAISEDGRAFDVHNPQTYGHDTAVNPVIVYLLFFCIVLWIVKNRKKHLREFRNRYFVVAVISFFVFCALLRWEPFVSRYMISYLAILCPALVGQLEIFFEETYNEKYKGAWIRIKTIICFMCITELCGVLIDNGWTALSKRGSAGYFVNRSEIYESYSKIAEAVNDKGYENIGLIIGGDVYEYPLTVMLDGYNRIEHVNVTNQTAMYEDESFIPDVIISIGYSMEKDNLYCHGKEYTISEVIDEGTYILN